ncbi:ATP-NAD kinase-like domain-containing protein [Absidia repens]|uniref:ATP-NAD kinase-like domain-containing protein n=1 Tax=Absidia repens TaxID=90262 RepID=A0A1X2I2K0_9FUNG|nr:ATP-NAD kinase-like domain-containing protein [Absidia repens]
MLYDSITLPVIHLDQPATLSVTGRRFVLTLHDKENTTAAAYPLHVIYGIHPNKSLSTLTLDLYLSPASLKDTTVALDSDNTHDGGDGDITTTTTTTTTTTPSPLRDTPVYGQTSLVLTINNWTDDDDTTDTLIQQLISTVLPRPNNDAYHIHPFLNPTSGHQKAVHAWQTTVLPMLQSAGFQSISPVIHTVAEQVRQQAYELGQQVIRQRPKTKALILCLGGDGTIHDLINGLLDALDEATTRSAAVAPGDDDNNNNAFASVFQLGVIPAGSGNAFASSLHLHTEDIGQAVLRIIHGDCRPFHLLDVTVGQVAPPSSSPEDDAKDWTDRVVMETTPAEQKHRGRRIFVVASWGFHAQIVSKSRYLRYVMGNKRFSLVAMALLFFLHHYKGDVVLKQTRRYDRATQTFVEEEAGTTTLSSSDPAQAGGFTYFLITKQAALEPGFCITPFASPFDHEMDVMCMRQATADQLKTVAGLAFQGGKHVDHPAVDYYKTQDVYLRVHEATDLCLDGEILPVRAMDVIRIQSIQDKVKKDAFVVFV